MVSSSTSAMADSQAWVQRLMRAFGSPKLGFSMELPLTEIGRLATGMA